jgi:hypothetical protein
MKQPVGRSAGIGLTYCRSDDCEGYWERPLPGSLWPEETEVEFGFQISDEGTKEMEE